MVEVMIPRNPVEIFCRFAKNRWYERTVSAYLRNKTCQLPRRLKKPRNIRKGQYFQFGRGIGEAPKPAVQNA